MDPWQVIAVVAAALASLAGAYAKLANDRLNASDKREERWDKRDERLLVVIENNTAAITKLGEQSTTSHAVLTQHDARALAVFDVAKAINQQTLATAERINTIDATTQRIEVKLDEHGRRIDAMVGDHK